MNSTPKASTITPHKIASWSYTNSTVVILILTGVVGVQVLPYLPSLWLVAGLSTLAFIVAWRFPRWRWLGLVVLGFAWTVWRADLALSSRLSRDLEGQDLKIVGQIVDLPKRQGESTSFLFAIEEAQLGDKPNILSGRVRLNWYTNAPILNPCSRWQLTVRLKRPRGLVNPGAYDFERHALEQGINAVGYVRDNVDNRALGRSMLCIDVWREHLSQGIADALGTTPVTPLLRALAVGDQRFLDESIWHVLRATGTGHLIAISGMHIGMLAGFGVLLARGFWRLRPRWALRWPAPLIEGPFGFFCAFVYSALAGFGLPTDRTLIMIGVVVVAGVTRRAVASTQALSMALLVLLMLDPLAVLSAGFWLSFVGVAWLIFCLDRGERLIHWGRELLRAQWVMSIGLLPLTVWFFGSSSLVGPIANLVAVPWISFVVVPLIIAGSLLAAVFPSLGAALIKLAALAMGGQWWLLEQQAAWSGAQWYFQQPSIFTFSLALLGALWLLLPRGVPMRALGAVLFLPLLWPIRDILPEGEFEAVMIDVGQGLSVLVRTREHALLYDTGARFPSGFDLGETAVVPSLHALGVGHLDRLVISHGDNDHAGGARAVIAAYPPGISESSEPQRVHVPAQRCQAGESWRWNEVSFRIVYASRDDSERGNDSSCVLSVRTADSELVLTGDISAQVEMSVAQALMPLAPKVALQVPHHGSKSSSSAAFLNAVHPILALVASGYRNRFGHPHPRVLERYMQMGIPVINTADTGFVRVHFASNGIIDVEETGRQTRHPYWRE